MRKYARAYERSDMDVSGFLAIGESNGVIKRIKGILSNSKPKTIC